jgi:DNA-binding NarL/FixJ family response regulator
MVQQRIRAVILMPTANMIFLPAKLEVLYLITKGLINKEIADKLNISCLTTVISHRKNITENWALNQWPMTIYAVMHGYVECRPYLNPNK